NPAFGGVPIYVSLAARMGCGLGACLVCTCGIRTADGDKNLRVCADGPVFKLDEVIL
ncbi:MAG: NAD-dependent dihydroorotate dehydrogenase B electron transfer subunit, partial [Clostridia bacterium]|nr:NAD-dependent dihydroorotate dehydrogenase B electron transfer subunit [Clostridia bacterium]